MTIQHTARSAAQESWLNIAPGSRLLLVASTGGHLTQLAKIAARLEASVDSTWVTFDSPQARSLLARYSDVRFIPYVAPRDIKGILRTVRAVVKIAREGKYAAAMSTGAGVALALPFLPRRMRRIYVESVSRVDGPSLTGKLLERVPGIERRTQHAAWASKRWPYEFTLLDDYHVVSRPRTSEQFAPLSILVTLGTIQPYRFDAAVGAVEKLLIPGDRVFWQVGCTTGRDLPGQVRESLGRGDLQGFAAQCDVVISHAGVGTAIDLLDLGIHPVLLPRRAQYEEHVDDHQAQIGAMLGDRNLATVRYPETLTRADLQTAAGFLVVSRADMGADEPIDDLSAELYGLIASERGVA
jgi:UDP-N-acetylglucosamine transferase subunit ALG13